MTLNGETLEKEFANEKELIAAADEMKKSRRNGKLHFKDRLHREFYKMIQDNADGYRQNVSKELTADADDDTYTKDDLGFVKKAKVSAPAAEQAHTADAAKSVSKKSKSHSKRVKNSAANIAERKYKEALAAAQAETEEYQKTVARLSEELKEADEKHMEAKSKFEEAKREYYRFVLDDDGDLHDYYMDLYSLPVRLFEERMLKKMKEDMKTNRGH